MYDMHTAIIMIQNCQLLNTYDFFQFEVLSVFRLLTSFFINEVILLARCNISETQGVVTTKQKQYIISLSHPLDALKMM